MSYIPVPDIPINQTQPYTYTHAKTLLEKVDQVIKSYSALDARITVLDANFESLVTSVNTACQSAIDECTKLATDAAAENTATANRLDGISQKVTVAVTYLQGAITDAQNALTAANSVVTEYHDDVARMEQEIADNNAAQNTTIANNYAQIQTKLTDGLNGKVDKGALYFDVRDYGAVGDGVNDDSDAFDAALAAAGHIGRVFVPGGHWRLTHPITLVTDATMEGVAMSDNTDAPDDSYILCDFDPTTYSGYAFYSPYGVHMRYLRFQGKDVGTCIYASGSIDLFEVSIRHFDTCMQLNHVYYGYLYRFRSYLNNLVVNSQFTHNITFMAPQISCVRNDGKGGVFLSGSNDRCEMKIFGGSIEGYSRAFSVPISAAITCNGVYFEVNQPDQTDNNSTIFYAESNNAFTIVMMGCYVYMGRTQLVFDLWAPATFTQKGTVTSIGNYFVGNSTTASAARCFNWYGSGGSLMNIFAAADMWSVGGGDYYTQGATLPGRSSIMLPPDPFNS